MLGTLVLYCRAFCAIASAFMNVVIRPPKVDVMSNRERRPRSAVRSAAASASLQSARMNATDIVPVHFPVPTSNRCTMTSHSHCQQLACCRFRRPACLLDMQGEVRDEST